MEEWIGGGYVVSASSGTAALTVALIALGIHPGDVVLLPSYTWAATGVAPLRIGAIPRFVDIDPNSYNISRVGGCDHTGRQGNHRGPHARH